MAQLQANLLSDSYWRLHRNAILSSLILFLVTNQQVSIDSIDGLTVSISYFLLSVIVFIWSTYAIIVLSLEGSREAALKTADTRADISQELTKIIEACDAVAKEINIRGARAQASISGIEGFARFLQISEEEKTPLAQLPPKEIRNLFDQRFDEIEKSLAHFKSLVSGSRTDLKRLSSLLTRRKKKIEVYLWKDRLRSFVTGLYLPAIFYVASLLYFIISIVISYFYTN